MVMRTIITSENPLLRQKAKKVRRFDPSFQRLIDDMFETMHALEGAGLAAPQIGISLRIFVAEYEDHKVAIINPEIVKSEGEVLGAEGCLSIPGYVGKNIRRAQSLLVKGQNVQGKQIKVHAEEWFARILQHEIDHLNGILFIDRLDRPEDLCEVHQNEQEEEEKAEVGASN